MNVMVAKRFLNKWGAEVRVAYNGQEAVDACKEQEFGLVLMDLQMPVMDGFEATRQIKAFKPHLPIMALTASSMNEVYKELNQVGIVEAMSKPFKPDNLLDKILSIRAQSMSNPGIAS